MTNWIYLDNNATTKLDERVLETMLPYLTELYGNAGSAHLMGLTINDAIEEAQLKVANLIGAKENEIIFTSGATESINHVLKGLIGHPKKHIISVVNEHSAVLDTLQSLTSFGFEITLLDINKDGGISYHELENAIRKDTALICIMLANNETGFIHSLQRISDLAHKNDILVFTDATQAVGKIPIDVKSLSIDFLAFSAHKFYGPKGIGGLYLSSNTKGKSNTFIHGGGQQKGRRSGTLNVPGIIGLGKASELAKTYMKNEAETICNLRNHLEANLLKIPETHLNGSSTNRLYNTSNICFSGIDSQRLIIRLRNICVSNGSACNAITTRPSHVLKALGLSDLDALASIRFSLGRFNTLEEVNETIDVFNQLIPRLNAFKYC